jgi:response regulator of citrate/malate metabolism
MEILILEDDIYLAQKVASRLQDEACNPTHHATISDVDDSKHYDTILLSTNIPVGNTEDIIKRYPNSIIILLVSYVSDATVAKPLKAGANDYVLKPFSMDELIRKIKHFEEFNKLQNKNRCLTNYMDFLFESTSCDIDLPNHFPFLIETNDQKVADKIVFESAKKLNKEIKFLSISKDLRVDVTKFSDKLIYIYDFHNIKNTSKEILLKSIEGLDVILCSFENEDDIPFEKVVVKNENTNITPNDSILTINDYVKMIVLKFQSKYPDTELSKKLGISRKSLWEKRKKFGIEKVK